MLTCSLTWGVCLDVILDFVQMTWKTHFLPLQKYTNNIPMRQYIYTLEVSPFKGKPCPHKLSNSLLSWQQIQCLNVHHAHTHLSNTGSNSILPPAVTEKCMTLFPIQTPLYSPVLRRWGQTQVGLWGDIYSLSGTPTVLWRGTWPPFSQPN